MLERTNSKDIHFIGDIHGDFHAYHTITQYLNFSIQLGDMGIGFGYDHLYCDEHNHEHDHMFIRGNHDNPAKCRELASYLGDYGYMEEKGIFYISGAYSTDKQHRTEGLDWWCDEQLSDAQFAEAIALFEETRPEIVVSHDCPWDCHPYHSITTKTARALGIMFSEHQPMFWIFGHHHRSIRMILDGTTFVGLDINEVISLSDLQLENVGI